MIRYVVGSALIVFMVVLTYGGITGRVRMKDKCCCPTDPDKDLRMRDT